MSVRGRAGQQRIGPSRATAACRRITEQFVNLAADVGNPRVVASSLVLLVIARGRRVRAVVGQADPMLMDSSAGFKAERRTPAGYRRVRPRPAEPHILGSRTSIVVAVLSVAAATVVGTIFGLVGSYFGGIWEVATMRTVDVLLTFPPILLACRRRLRGAQLAQPGRRHRLALYAAVRPDRPWSRVAGQTARVRRGRPRPRCRDPRILWLAVLPNILAPHLRPDFAQPRLRHPA